MNSLFSFASTSKGIPLLNSIRKQTLLTSLNYASTQANPETTEANQYNFEYLRVENLKNFVFHVELNRPKKMNAMNRSFWQEIGECFIKLGKDSECRAVVLSGAGKMFSSGIDIMDFGQAAAQFSDSQDVARKARAWKEIITNFQKSFTLIEKCPKPVIAAIHNGCIGGGINMVSACDIRYCTQDAWFQIKEVEIGLAADVGVLQRLPKAVGNDSLARELSYTARKFLSEEALQLGFVSRILLDKEQLLRAAFDLAQTIASKSPVAVQGSKVNLNYSRDHSVDESLDYMANWNMSMLQTEDIMRAVETMMEKSEKPPTFSKL